ncbi:MAG: TIGR04013 family B12-binding domain/radical SAM domain-containing protein, partial [Promethearchaeota archaeon]
GLRSQYQQVIFAESYNTLSQNEVESEIRTLRNLNDKVIFIAGGPHPSGDPSSALKAGFDYVVIGEGERTLANLVYRLNKNQDTTSIPGIAFLNENGQVEQTVSADSISLDESIPYSTSPPIHPQIEILRGCPFRCHFCQVPALFGKPRSRSISSTKKIVEHYVSWFGKRGMVDLRFVAPNSLAYGSPTGRKLSLTQIEKLFKAISFDPRIRIFYASFPSEIRPEFLTTDVIQLFKEYISNEKIAIGGQSGSDRVLKLMRRGHDVPCILEAVDLTHKNGFIPSVDILFGFPGETPEDQWQTVDLIKRVGSKGGEVRLHYFLPLPGTSVSHLRPSPVSDSLLRELGSLTKDQTAVGSFLNQLRFVQTSLKH